MLNKKTLLFVFGTRPEAIKMAPLVLKAKADNVFDVKVCVTAQHRGMLDQVLEFFKIEVDSDLNIMKPGQTLNGITSLIISKIDDVIQTFKPHCILVHGDTTTTLAVSQAAFHAKVPVAHVEAGLRTYDFLSPWPEEMNRRVVGLLASFHFCPTEVSANNLKRENIPFPKIFVTGNTVVDALRVGVETIEKDTAIKGKLDQKFSFLDPNKKLILVTGHRRENFGQAFENICHGIKKVAAGQDVQVLYPVHLNPQVQKPVKEILSNLNNVYLIDPVDYVEFIYLMKKSYFILTDSGGVQEEAPSLRKPVLVMRDTSERQEAIDAGCAKLVGTNTEVIYTESQKLLESKAVYNSMICSANPYGDGYASDKILNILTQVLN